MVPESHVVGGRLGRAQSLSKQLTVLVDASAKFCCVATE